METPVSLNPLNIQEKDLANPMTHSEQVKKKTKMTTFFLSPCGRRNRTELLHPWTGYL